MHRRVYILGVAVVLLGLAAAFVPAERDFAKDEKLSVVLQSLGDPVPDHARPDATLEQVQLGYELVHEGKVKTPPAGERSRFISPFFSCTSCHNMVREEEDISSTSPEDRLRYAEAHDMPFLQGSTFWGIANRRSWYNDDYVLKYGDLVKAAEHSLAESTQLCAVECSQGRPLDEWELEAILAYYWTLELRLSDLALTAEDWKTLKSADPANAVAMLKGKYMQRSPANFAHMPEDLRKGYDHVGRPEKGKFIYENGCQHCHDAEGESGVILDDYPTTFNWLKSNMYNWDDLGLYHIVRKGTYATRGARAYMPHYTEQKMSDQQVEDLRAYIEQMATTK